MENSNTDHQWSEDEQAMVALLHSMGVTVFDPSVPAALNEYAKSMLNLLLVALWLVFTENIILSFSLSKGMRPKLSQMRRITRFTVGRR